MKKIARQLPLSGSFRTATAARTFGLPIPATAGTVRTRKPTFARTYLNAHM